MITASLWLRHGLDPLDQAIEDIAPLLILEDFQFGLCGCIIDKLILARGGRRCYPAGFNPITVSVSATLRIRRRAAAHAARRRSGAR